MKNGQKNWIWFVLLMGLILAAGMILSSNRRRDPGESLRYSIDEFTQVDPALIRYHETEGWSPELKKITALSMAPDGNLYVAGENGLVIFPAKKQLAIDGSPTCLTVDTGGKIYLGMRDHVVVLATDGSVESEWDSLGEKAFLTSIGVSDDFVYVADAGNRCVWRYSRSGGEPFPIGNKDAEQGILGFVVPSPFFDLSVATDGTIWAVNPGRHALENYRSDGSLVSRWEKMTMRIEGFSGCCNPSHIALLPNGSFVTAEKGLARVKIHAPDGGFSCVVAAPDQFDAEITGLDLATDSAGRIYVLDPSRNQVRVFEENQ